MVITLLTNAEHVLKDGLTYAMLYAMFDKINDDLEGALEYEKDELTKLFKACEESSLPPEEAVVKHTARITSYSNTAMFRARQAAA